MYLHFSHLVVTRKAIPCITPTPYCPGLVAGIFPYDFCRKALSCYFTVFFIIMLSAKFEHYYRYINLHVYTETTISLARLFTHSPRSAGYAC